MLDGKVNTVAPIHHRTTIWGRTDRLKTIPAATKVQKFLGGDKIQQVTGSLSREALTNTVEDEQIPNHGSGKQNENGLHQSSFAESANNKRRQAEAQTECRQHQSQPKNMLRDAAEWQVQVPTASPKTGAESPEMNRAARRLQLKCWYELLRAGGSEARTHARTCLAESTMEAELGFGAGSSRTPPPRRRKSQARNIRRAVGGRRGKADKGDDDEAVGGGIPSSAQRT